VQNHKEKRQDYGDLRKSQAQAEAGLILNVPEGTQIPICL